MNTLAPTTAASVLDRRVEDIGGLSASALVYLGSAYLYLYLLTAGGS